VDTTAGLRRSEVGKPSVTYVGVLSVAPGGFWYDDFPTFYGIQCDWDEICATSESGDGTEDDTTFDSSFDFYASTDGEFLSTAVIESTITGDPTTVTPGFTALISLLALGTLAFLAPRFKRN
jgi:hypothetical protein